MKTNKPYHGWWVVFCAFVIALYGWGLGFYGLSLYLVALQKAHGWSPATISSAITFYYVAGAFLVMQVGDVIQKHGARLVVIAGAGLMGVGVLGLTVIDRPWQLYLAFLLMIPGWAAMGGGSINTIIAQWFNRRRGLAASLALNGATCGGLLFAPAFAWAIDTLGFAKACMAAVAFVLVTLWPLAFLALRPRRDGEHDAGDEPTAAHDMGGEPMSRGQLLREPRYLTMVGAFSLGLLAQISFIAHQVAYLEPTLGLKGAGWAVSLTSMSALVGRLAVGLVIDRVDRRGASAAVLCVQVSSMIVLLSSDSLFRALSRLHPVRLRRRQPDHPARPDRAAGIPAPRLRPRRQPQRGDQPARRRDRTVHPGRAARPVGQLPHLADGLPRCCRPRRRSSCCPPAAGVRDA